LQKFGIYHAMPGEHQVGHATDFSFMLEWLMMHKALLH